MRAMYNENDGHRMWLKELGMNRIGLTLLSLLLGAGLLPGSAVASVSLELEVTRGRAPELFGDGMVLQRDQPVPIWGRAAPGEAVTVTLEGQHKSVTTGSDGRWRVDLDPMASGGPFDMIIAGQNTIQIHDVWVGEVWLCSGQSNMVIHRVHGATLASHPGVHALGKRRWGDRPAGSCFWFGVALNDTLGVAVGLLNRAVGGSKIRYWVGPEIANDPDPALPAIRAGWRSEGKHYRKWIAPLEPYAIRGVAWWQGEADRRWPEDQVHALPALIRSWRADWGLGDLPFVFVQLPSGGGLAPGAALAGLPEDASASHRRAENRFVYFKTLEVPKTVLMISIDLKGGLHPGPIRVYGERLGLATLGSVYGIDSTYSGPIYASKVYEGNRIRLRFRENTATGLHSQGGALQGFAISADGENFLWAQAEIQGTEVVVWNDALPNPSSVRYAWGSNPKWANLFNDHDLGAAPFSTEADPGPY